METIIIQAQTPEEIKLIQEFLKKHKLKSRSFSKDDQEDLLLFELMEETDYNDIVPTDTFLKNLRG